MAINPWRRPLTRRELLGLFGSSAALTFVASCNEDTSSQQTSEDAIHQTTSSDIVFPEGAVVRTILGDISPEVLAMGATMFHEHLQFSFRMYTSPANDVRPSGSSSLTVEETAEAIDLTVKEMQMAMADGLHCIVDAAVGRRSDREIDNLRAMATRSGVHVVVAGTYFKAPYPDDIVAMDEDSIADHLVADADLQRWGAFGEVGTSMQMHPDEAKFLRAVSQAHLRTKLPIFTHTEHEGCAPCALDQLDLLEREGVDPANLCIGHLTDIKPEAEPLGQTAKAIAKRGAFLGFDTVGHEMSASSIPAAHKVRYVMEVLEAGFEDNLLLAADFSQSRQLKSNWGNGFSTVLVQFVPKLRYAGVDDATLHKILVDNPRRFLSFVPPDV